MDYVVTAGLEPPVETSELDPLQREGVAAVLDRQLGLVEGVAGPSDDIDVLDYRVTVHPDGASVVLALDAPSLRAAEDAAATVADVLLHESELLVGWVVTESKVQITEDEFNLSLAGADEAAGLGDAEAALEAAVEEALENGDADTDQPPLDTEHWRAKLTELASRLRAFTPSTFATASSKKADATLAAGAVIHAVRVVTDEIFYDEMALAINNATADHAIGLLVLEELPPCYEHRYDSGFARSFLLASAVVATRLTYPQWVPPRRVAEQLAMRLIITEARVVLEAAALMTWDESEPLFAAFTEHAIPDRDFEQLYDVDVMLGPDQEEPNASQAALAEQELQTRNLHFDAWFHLPDDEGQHPYLG